MPSFTSLASAAKRARHFAEPIALQVAGPFTALRNPSARNYAMLLDAREPGVSTVARELEDLCLLHAWAQSINRRCAVQRIAGDIDTLYELASFNARLPIDPTRIPAEHGHPRAHPSM